VFVLLCVCVCVSTGTDVRRARSICCHSECLYVCAREYLYVRLHVCARVCACLFVHVCVSMCVRVFVYLCERVLICVYCMHVRECVCMCVCRIFFFARVRECVFVYGVATISRLLRIIGLFCRRAL